MSGGVHYCVHLFVFGQSEFWEDTTKTFEVELRNQGNDGDAVAGDNVFSMKIPDRGFGIYRLIIEATDAFNNKATVEVESDFVLH